MNDGRLEKLQDVLDGYINVSVKLEQAIQSETDNSSNAEDINMLTSIKSNVSKNIGDITIMIAILKENPSDDSSDVVEAAAE